MEADPDRLLTDLRFVVDELDTLLRQGDVVMPLAVCVVERFKMLDEHISKGRTKPMDWS